MTGDTSRQFVDQVATRDMQDRKSSDELLVTLFVRALALALAFNVLYSYFFTLLAYVSYTIV